MFQIIAEYLEIVYRKKDNRYVNAPFKIDY